MRTVLALVLGASLAAATREGMPGPVVVQAGVGVGTSEARDASGDLIFSAGAGWRAWQRGLVGPMGADVEILGSAGDHGRMERYGVWYAERTAVDPRVYVGGGVGLWYVRRTDTTAAPTTDSVFRPAARLIVGGLLPGSSRRLSLALEGQATYAAPLGDIELAAVGLGLAVGF